MKRAFLLLAGLLAQSLVYAVVGKPVAANPIAARFAHAVDSDLDNVMTWVNDPEITGNLTTRVVNTGLQIESQDTRLELKNQATGDTVATLDIPVLVNIHLEDFAVTLDSATVKINDAQIGG